MPEVSTYEPNKSYNPQEYSKRRKMVDNHNYDAPIELDESLETDISPSIGVFSPQTTGQEKVFATPPPPTPPPSPVPKVEQNGARPKIKEWDEFELRDVEFDDDDTEKIVPEKRSSGGSEKIKDKSQPFGSESDKVPNVLTSEKNSSKESDGTRKVKQKREGVQEKMSDEDRQKSFSGYPKSPGSHGFVILNTKERKTQNNVKLSLDLTRFIESSVDRFQEALEKNRNEKLLSTIFAGLWESFKDSAMISVENNDDDSRTPSSNDESDDEKMTISEMDDEEKRLAEAIEDSIKLAYSGDVVEDEELSEKWMKVSDSFEKAAHSLGSSSSDKTKSSEKRILFADHVLDDGEVTVEEKGAEKKQHQLLILGTDKTCCVCEESDISFYATSEKRQFILHPNHDKLPLDVVEVREIVDGKLLVYTEKHPISKSKERQSSTEFQSRWTQDEDEDLSDFPTPGSLRPTQSAMVNIVGHGSELEDASIRVIYPTASFQPKQVPSGMRIGYFGPKSTKRFTRKRVSDSNELRPKEERSCSPGQLQNSNAGALDSGFLSERKRSVKDDTENKGYVPKVTSIWNFTHDLHMSGSMVGPPLDLRLNADHCVDEAMMALMYPSRIPLNYYKELWVHFKDKNGILEKRERSSTLFFRFSQEIFSPGPTNIFDCPSEVSTVIHLNPAYQHDDMRVRFAGTILALAILHSQKLSCKFPVAFFKCLLDRPFTVKDLKEIDPILFTKLEWLKHNNLDESDICIKFNMKDKFGNTVIHRDLIPDGSSICATEETKQRYIEKTVIWKLVERSMKQLKEFRRGFVSVLEPLLLSVFTAEEIQNILDADEGDSTPEVLDISERKETY